jgi:uncharacterized protein (DUF1697 family)
MAGAAARTWVALLYSIVLAPKRRVIMADLRELARELGYAAPRTLLASGNLIFEAEAEDARGIEARLEPAFAERFGRAIEIIVRDGAEWERLVDGNPFPEAAERAPSRVWARVMRAPVDAGLLERLEPYRAAEEKVAVVGGDLWVFLPDGAAGSRLASAMTPARTGGAGTFRNWNTLRKIAAALDG